MEEESLMWNILLETYLKPMKTRSPLLPNRSTDISLMFEEKVNIVAEDFYLVKIDMKVALKRGTS